MRSTFSKSWWVSVELKPLEAGKAVRVGAVKVVPNPTSHLDDLKNSFGKKYRQGFECFSFSMEGAGKRVGHSADIGSLSDLEPLVAKPLDHLVCELAHCELDSICEMLVGEEDRSNHVHPSGPATLGKFVGDSAEVEGEIGWNTV